MSCCEADCGYESSEGRRFLTTDEKVARLQKYKDWLESEANGVTEAITHLKKAK